MTLYFLVFNRPFSSPQVDRYTTTIEWIDRVGIVDLQLQVA